MATIHHASLKKAEKAGISIQDHGNSISCVDKDTGEVLSKGEDIRATIDAAVVKKLSAKSEAEEARKSRRPAAAKKTAKKTSRRKADEDEGEGDEEGEGEGEGEGGSIVKDKYRKNYNEDDNNGDRLATLVTSMVKEQGVAAAIKAIAKENGVDVSKWSHLRNGQQSMNLRNTLRGMVRRGEKVTVGGKTVASLGEKYVPNKTGDK
jgi:hypothetical protein